MTKNIKEISVGNELTNVSINGAPDKSAILYVYDEALKGLPSRNGRLVCVAVTSLSKKNGAPYCIYAKSTHACLFYDDTTGRIIDVEKSNITIR
ncbi:hypothetical protein FACS189462_2760 [Spirochaetia bacterium]|nr:hypothetical protein FACS189462_2760 [Spirochaetia bacterium]